MPSMCSARRSADVCESSSADVSAASCVEVQAPSVSAHLNPEAVVLRIHVALCELAIPLTRHHLVVLLVDLRAAIRTASIAADCEHAAESVDGADYFVYFQLSPPAGTLVARGTAVLHRSYCIQAHCKAPPLKFLHGLSRAQVVRVDGPRLASTVRSILCLTQRGHISRELHVASVGGQRVSAEGQRQEESLSLAGGMCVCSKASAMEVPDVPPQKPSHLRQ